MFIRENETLYLDAWKYNATLIIDGLRDMVIKNGGKVKPQNGGYVVNRSLTSAINKLKININGITEAMERNNDNKNEIRREALKKYNLELKELQSIKNAPIHVKGASYATFAFDNMLYYVELPDNPFFDWYYSKTPIINNSYSKDVYSSAYDLKEINDDFLSFRKITSERINEATKALFNFLISAQQSEKYTETTKKRVANLYNGGYHFENVARKERREAINF